MEDTPEFTFSDQAKQLSASVPTTTLYQVLLGRDPENSHVIEEAKTQPIEAVFRSFVRSAEFTDHVVAPLQAGARLRHELTSPAPDPSQLQWLASLLVLSRAQYKAICEATSWPGFFQALLQFSEPQEPPLVPIAPATATEANAIRHNLILLAMAEIVEIESRLDRLKTLFQGLRDQSPGV